MKNVLEWLEEAVRRYPDKDAFRSEEKRITFSQVQQLAKSVGAALLEACPNSAEAAEEADAAGLYRIAAVFGSRAVETPALYMGAVYAGMAYAPLDAELPAARIEKILKNLKPAVLLTDAESRGRLETLLQEMDGEGAPPVVCVDPEEGRIQTGSASGERTIRELTEQEEQLLEAVRRRSVLTDPLYVIYTSGSSGNPKGVMTSHLALKTYLEAYCKMMQITEEDILGNQSPLDYIAAIRDIYLPFLTGCTTVILEKRLFMDPDGLFTCLNEQGVTTLGWSVSALTIPVRLGAFQEKTLTTVRKVCFSGSVMPGAILRVWQEHLPEAVFVNQYGPTEAAASCTFYRVDHLVREDESLPIGRPYENYHVFLLDEKGEIPAAGELGEICVSGPALALGYCSDPERTRESFVLNPLNKAYPERMYRTGDLGSLDAEGLLHFHGRRDRQIKHMGHRVELDEIECAAMAVAGVTEACCLYDPKKECLWLFCAGTEDKRALALGLRERLPGFMVPRRLRLLDALPKLPNGKNDMEAMRQQIS